MPTDTSFRIVKKEGKPEPVSRANRDIVDKLKGSETGVVISGAIGEEKETLEPAPEDISPEQEKERTELKEFIMRHVTPHTIGGKAKPREEKNLFVRKMQKQTLADLKRIWPGPVVPDDKMTDDMLAELQARFDDVSP